MYLIPKIQHPYHASERPLDHAESNDQNHEISWHPTYDCLAMSLSYLPRLHTQVCEYIQYLANSCHPPVKRCTYSTVVIGVAPFNDPRYVYFIFLGLEYSTHMCMYALHSSATAWPRYSTMMDSRLEINPSPLSKCSSAPQFWAWRNSKSKSSAVLNSQVRNRRS